MERQEEKQGVDIEVQEREDDGLDESGNSGGELNSAA